MIKKHHLHWLKKQLHTHRQGLLVLFGFIIMIMVVEAVVLSFLLNSSRSFSQDQSDQFDPYELITLIQKNNQSYVLVDIRGEDEFNKEHIRTAINLPYAEIMNNNVIKDRFKDKNKIIIIYGDTAYSTDTVTATDVLAKKGLHVERLAIGWNEWRHFRNLWIPAAQWDRVHIEDYISNEQ